MLVSSFPLGSHPPQCGTPGDNRNHSLNRLLLETHTYPLPDRTTEPADVRLVAAAVAQIHGVSPDEVAEVTWHNLSQLLGHVLPTKGPRGPFAPQL